MDKIIKAILFGGKAIVSLVDCKELAREAVILHNPSSGAAEVFGRILGLTAFMSAGIKGTSIKLSIMFDGDGKIGKIITCGNSGGVVRGYMEHADARLDLLDNGRVDVASGLGKNGSITIIKDFGMKEPYVGNSNFIKGDIDSDFAYYFTSSEQLPSAVASGCVINSTTTEVLSCGAIIVQPMPNCEEEILVILEDIVRNFTDFGRILLEMSAEEIINFHFGHFECKLLPSIHPKYECNCAQERMDSIVLSLGVDEANEIVDEVGKIEIKCDFCKKNYNYLADDLKRLFA